MIIWGALEVPRVEVGKHLAGYLINLLKLVLSILMSNFPKMTLTLTIMQNRKNQISLPNTISRPDKSR